MNTEIIVKFEKVTKKYGSANTVFFALDGVDLEICIGQRVAVTGPSGSGKTTLLNLLCGLDEPTAGKVFFDGLDLSKMSDDELTRLRREKIGMIFQTFNLLPTLSAVENVSLPLRLQGKVSRRDSEKTAKEMLDQVGLQNRFFHFPDELSGGERQRVAIARALIFQPLLLLADEPTGNLDSETGGEVLNLLDQLHQKFNMTILLVTHNELAAAHCERHITMRDGRFTADVLNPVAK